MISPFGKGASPQPCEGSTPRCWKHTMVEGSCLHPLVAGLPSSIWLASFHAKHKAGQNGPLVGFSLAAARLLFVYPRCTAKQLLQGRQKAEFLLLILNGAMGTCFPFPGWLFLFQSFLVASIRSFLALFLSHKHLHGQQWWMRTGLRAAHCVTTSVPVQARLPAEG